MTLKAARVSSGLNGSRRRHQACHFCLGLGSDEGLRTFRGVGRDRDLILYRDDALLYIAHVMLMWDAPIPAGR